MPDVKVIIDPKKPPKLSTEDRAMLDRLANMPTDQIEANAASDPDNPPFTDSELERGVSARLVRSVRASTGLSQTAFARAYQINHGRLRDLEQGRTAADSALLAYLRVIERNREAVDRALSP